MVIVSRYIRSLRLLSAMIQSLSSGGNMLLLDRTHCTLHDHHILDVHNFTNQKIAFKNWMILGITQRHKDDLYINLWNIFSISLQQMALYEEAVLNLLLWQSWSMAVFPKCILNLKGHPLDGKQEGCFCCPFPLEMLAAWPSSWPPSFSTKNHWPRMIIQKKGFWFKAELWGN